VDLGKKRNGERRREKRIGKEKDKENGNDGEEGKKSTQSKNSRYGLGRGYKLHLSTNGYGGTAIF